MIDIHTHVLPSIDDGAKDVETAIALLEGLKAQGVDRVVFTPHYYAQKGSVAQFLEERQKAFERIYPYIPKGMDVRLGAEVHFTGVNDADFGELCDLAIEGTKYILMEFPFVTVWESALFSALEEFMGETGYIPIIAHIERYVETHKNPAIVNRLIEMGCLIQVNAHAFTDKNIAKLTLPLLKRGLVHCIGSDAHDLEKRFPKHAQAIEALSKARLLPMWERAQSIMKEVLAGGQVFVECGKPVKKRFGKFR